MDSSNYCPYKQLQKDQGIPQSQGYNPLAPGPNTSNSGYNPPSTFSTDETNPGISKIGMSRVTKSEAPGHYNMNNNVNYNRQMTHQSPANNQNPYHAPNPQNSYHPPTGLNQPPSGYNPPPPNPPPGPGGYYPGPGSGNV